MKSLKIVVAILCATLGGLIAFSGDAWAQDAEFLKPDTAERETPSSSNKINLDVKDRDLAEILQFISRRVGVNIIPDPNIKEKVSIRLENMDWREALDAIARQTSCKIVTESANYIRFTQPTVINMEFQDADIRVVLELLAKQAGANIVISDNVKGKISLSLRDVPWQDALETIVKANGFTIVRADTPNAEIIRIVHPESIAEQLESRSFTLRYVRPEDPYRAMISNVEQHAVSKSAFAGASGSISQAAGGAPGEAEEEFSLKTALEKALSKNGQLQFNKETNTFIVKDIKPRLDEIEQIIKLVDVEPPLIYVEVKFVSTRSTDILEHGVKFDLADTPERDGPTISMRGAAPDSTATDPLFLFGGTYPFDIGKLHQFDDNFQALGILDFTQLRAVLRLLKDDENSRLIQEPTLTVVNNHPATIFVGDTVPFAVQNVQQDQNGNITAAIDENKRSPINIGFTLYLIPHVVPGTDLIDMTVIPNVSRLSGTTSPGIPGFERFVFEQEGTSNFSFIDLPRETKQTLVTYLRVQDRHTAVIGGLHTQEKLEIVSKVPLLSSIPVLGNLFTWKRKDNRVSSLIIMITPHILRNAGEANEVFRRSEEKHRERDFFYDKYERDQNKKSGT
jgi:type IV pilus assembly protein PilQ